VREDLPDFQKREHKPKSRNNYFSSLFGKCLSIMSAPIMIKEALALSNSLLSVSDVICNKRIVAYVDNQAVVYAI
jgi:hypothetical protein